MSSGASSHRRFEHRFYLAGGAVFLALVFWTFSRTYYLKVFFKTPALPVLLHVHAAVMTGWVVLLLAQAGLVAARQVQWHRRLGVFGTFWALFVVILGCTTTLHAAAREVHNHSDGASLQVSITSLEVMQMALFAALACTALLLRNRPDYHKRLMLLTIACMLPSAIGRLPFDFVDNVVILLSLDVFVIGCVVVDTFRHRRLHPAFGYGAALVLFSLNFGFPLVMRPAWIAFGTSLLS